MLRKPAGVIIPTALTLFSMFFGAGNLIFPPILGQLAGEHFTPAILGFLLGGIGLPVLTVITMAMTGSDVRSLGARCGKSFNIAFCVVAYLAVGAMYAIPRTGAVSYSAVVDPVLQPVGDANALVAHAGFNALFFALALLLALHPEGIVNALGKVLTPILLGLLVLMVTLVLWHFGNTPAGTALAPYDHKPLTAGFLEGYLTMDSIAALAFGILVVSALRPQAEHSVLKSATAVSLIAGGLLAAIYLGLGLIGLHFHGTTYDGFNDGFNDGAVLLAHSAHEVLGPWGQLIFGLTVLLACMTTAVGLLAATSEFFHRLMPGIAYRSWLVTFTVVSFFIASLGLSTMLSVAAPLIAFIYPIAITLVIATLSGRIINSSVRGSQDPTLWSFRFAAWTTALCSALATAQALGVPGASVDWLPFAQEQLAWVVPALLAYVLGLMLDGVRYRKELGARHAV